MLQEAGRVVEVHADGCIEVETRLQGSCSACSSTHCAASVVSGLFKAKANTLTVKNTLNAEVGENILLSIPDKLLIRSALIGYLWPLLIMLLCAITTHYLGGGELVQFFMALVGFAGGLLLARWYTSQHHETKRITLRALYGSPHIRL